MTTDENSDTICIHELELQARVGVPEEERAEPQRLTISIKFWPRNSFSEMGNQLDRTVDYSEVARAVKEFTADRADKLIETLAYKIAAHLLETFPIRRVGIELRKFVLPDAKYVAVVCERDAN